MTNIELVELALSVIHPKKYNDFVIGNVGCALITKNNNVYTGVCIDTSSSLGFCAEHNAIGNMITNEEYDIDKIVAVYKENNKVFVLSPCGRCREFMYQINNDNLNAEVILEPNKTVLLSELLPYNNWVHEIDL